jgi:hypothetical protein
MANQFKMDKVLAVLALHKADWSNRRIARELGIHREKGDRAFRPSVPSADRARLEAFVMPSNEIYLVGFQRAADMIVAGAQADKQNPDDLFCPIAYLYRHHLELMLKELVHLGIHLGSLKDCEGILGGHNLHKLWNKAKQLIKEVWPDSPNDDLNAVEKRILEFHKLDPTGQAFRYARDKDGAPHLQGAPQRIDLNNLKAVVDSFSKFLDATYTGIDYCDPGPL